MEEAQGEPNSTVMSVIVQNLLKNYLNLFNNKFINNFNINQNNLLLLNENIPPDNSTAVVDRKNVTAEMIQRLFRTHRVTAVNGENLTRISNNSQFLKMIRERETSLNLSTGFPSSENSTNSTTLEDTDLEEMSMTEIVFHFLSKVTSHEEFFLFFLLILLAILTIFGNLLVIVSINVYKKLHTPTNYLIKNLAFTDLLVGIVIMPVAAMYEIILRRNWPFGVNFCDLWRSMDVLLSTTSILNLCFISYDRYYALQSPFLYKKFFTKNLIKCFCALSWILGILISFPAILWWRYDRNYFMPNLRCLFTSNQVYLILSSTVSFYIPLSIMIVFYWKIYRLAMEQNLSLRMGNKKILILKKKKNKKKKNLKRKETFLRNSASALPFSFGHFSPTRATGDSNDEVDDGEDTDDDRGGVVFQNLRVHRGRGNSETTTATCAKIQPVKPRNYSAGSVQILNEKVPTSRCPNQPTVMEDLTSMSIPNNLNLVLTTKPKFSTNMDMSQSRRTGSEPEVQRLSCKSPLSPVSPHYRSSADATDFKKAQGRTGSMGDDANNTNNGWVNNPLNILLKFNQNMQKKKRFYFLSLKLSREKKAAKTLGIVMGVFLLCWCPFFVCNLFTSFVAEDVLINSVFGGDRPAFHRLVNVVTWFGWLNSLLNPIIYASWSTEFRRAFVNVIKRYFYNCFWLCGGKAARQRITRNKFRRRTRKFKL